MSQFGGVPVGQPQPQKSGSRFGGVPVTGPSVGGPELDHAPPGTTKGPDRASASTILEFATRTGTPLGEARRFFERIGRDFSAGADQAIRGVSDVVERPVGNLEGGNVLTGVPRVGLGLLQAGLSPVSAAVSPIIEPVAQPIVEGIEENISKPIERYTGYPSDVTTPLAAQVLTAGIAKGVRGAMPKTTPVKAQLAQRVMQHRIPVYPGQLADNPLVRNTYDLADKLSIYDNGARARQADAIAETQSRLMGSQGTDLRLSSADANIRLGGVTDPANPLGPKLTPGVYDQIYGRIGTHTFDNTALNEIARLDQRAATLPDNARAAVTNAIDNVMSAVNNWRISIQGFKELTDQGGALSVLENNVNPALALYGRQLRGLLERNIMRQASPADAAALRQADSQWRHMKTLEPAIARSADAEGQIPITRLQSDLATATQRANARNNSGMYTMEMLAEAGQSFLRPPRTSGTAERLPIAQLLTGAGGGFVGAGAAGASGAIPAALAALALPPLVRRALQSQPLARAMIAEALARGANPSRLRRAIINSLRDARATVPAAAAATSAQDER